MIRGISTPNYRTALYDLGQSPRLLWDPVYVCDTRLLSTMMLRAWRPELDREIRKMLWEELKQGEAAA